ncbi:MAG: erythromycin biosynthesis sensory transduction protein eryC1, partial [Thermoanaerobacteraceae bacterium]|nr:erythromycin biosynthesis sensory transduction protein eryC1 [Thermoanaerobacteraceae bacterium]
GYNSRLDEIQAAILRVKLTHVDEWNENRRQAAHKYNELLKDVPGIKTPYEAPYAKHVYHQYTIRILNNKRDDVKEKLAKAGIGTMVYYPVPVDNLPVYKHINTNCSIAEKLARQVLSLPIGPKMQLVQEQVVKRLRRIMT